MGDGEWRARGGVECPPPPLCCCCCCCWKSSPVLKLLQKWIQSPRFIERTILKEQFWWKCPYWFMKDKCKVFIKWSQPTDLTSTNVKLHRQHFTTFWRAVSPCMGDVVFCLGWLSLAVLYLVVSRFLAGLFLRHYHPYNRKTRPYITIIHYTLHE